MAYCRFSEGDIYLIKIDVDEWECLRCLLSRSKDNLSFYSLPEVLKHIKEHEDAGHEICHSDYRIKAEFVEMLKDSPTPENIDVAIQQFFSKNPYFDNLDCLFLSPSIDWQGQFLAILETIDFTIVRKNISHYFIFLNYVNRFDDRERAFRILKTWEAEIIKQMDKMGIDSQSIIDELEESLHDLRDAYSQI